VKGLKKKASVEEFLTNGLCNWNDCEFNKESEVWTENKCTNEDVNPETCPSAKESYEWAKENMLI